MGKAAILVRFPQWIAVSTTIGDFRVSAQSRTAGSSGRSGENRDSVSELRRARALIDSAIEHRTEDAIHTANEWPVASVRLTEFIDSARSNVVCCISTPAFAVTLNMTLANPDLLRRNLPVKILCDRAVAHSDSVLGIATTGNPAVRVSTFTCTSHDWVICDGRIALISLPEPGPMTLVVNSPGVVHLMNNWFEQGWRVAYSHAAESSLAHRRQCALTQQVLGLLAQGVKDEVAARTLEVSVRTYRRHVANLLRDLNVDSRFQVGMRAVQLGLMHTGEPLAALPAITEG